MISTKLADCSACAHVYFHFFPESTILGLMQSGTGGRWGQAAKDEASRAGKSAKSAYHDGKGAAHSAYDDVTGAVASTFHDAKESARATVTDFEESGKSALDRLRSRLEYDMEPHNFVDERLSLGLIPSNTEVQHHISKENQETMDRLSGFSSLCLCCLKTANLCSTACRYRDAGPILYPGFAGFQGRLFTCKWPMRSGKQANLLSSCCAGGIGFSRNCKQVDSRGYPQN